MYWLPQIPNPPGGARPKSIVPIRLARSAIGESNPRNDLYLSPDHSLYADGAFIPAKFLVNGTSISPALPTDVDALEYYNIELDTHEVIYAEGACVESLLVYDDGVR